MSRVFKILLTFFCGVAAFIFFLLLFFPLRPIFNHALANIESFAGGQYRIAVEDMNPSLVFDSVFEGVVISKRGKAGFEKFLTIDRVDVDVALFSLLTKTINLDFSAEFAGGTIEGSFKTVDARNQVDLKFEDIKISQLDYLKDPLLSLGASFSTQGQLDGDAFFAFSEQGLRDAEAEFNVRLTQLKLQQTQIRLSSDPGSLPIDLGDLELSDAEHPAIIQASLVNNQVRFHDVTLPGPDVKMELKGKLNLKEEKNDKISVVRTDVKGRLGLSERVVKGLPILSLLDAQKDADGYYPVTIGGKPDKPTFKIGDMDIGSLFHLDNPTEAE